MERLAQVVTRRQDLIAEIGAASQAYQRASDGFDDAVAGLLGVNRTDLRCLDWLSSGPITIGRLADVTGLSSAAATSLVDRLERKGYVRRVRDGADRRRILVELTEAALARVGEVYGPIVSDGVALLAGYDEREQRLVRDFLRESSAISERHRRRIG